MHGEDTGQLFRRGAFSPPPRLLASSVTVRYMHAYYWAVAISTQVTDPLPDTVAQLAFSLIVAAGGVLVLSIIFGAATTVGATLPTGSRGSLLILPAFTKHHPLGVSSQPGLCPHTSHSYPDLCPRPRSPRVQVIADLQAQSTVSQQKLLRIVRGVPQPQLRQARRASAPRLASSLA